jgi:hypothetical protein
MTGMEDLVRSHISASHCLYHGDPSEGGNEAAFGKSEVDSSGGLAGDDGASVGEDEFVMIGSSCLTQKMI